jgi:hypothetical protein
MRAGLDFYGALIAFLKRQRIIVARIQATGCSGDTSATPSVFDALGDSRDGCDDRCNNGDDEETHFVGMVDLTRSTPQEVRVGSFEVVESEECLEGESWLAMAIYTSLKRFYGAKLKLHLCQGCGSICIANAAGCGSERSDC